jgi:hypothetical protein
MGKEKAEAELESAWAFLHEPKGIVVSCQDFMNVLKNGYTWLENDDQMGSIPDIDKSEVLSDSSNTGLYSYTVGTGRSKLIRANKTQLDSPVTMVDVDCNGFKVFTNTDAVSETIMLLPNGVDGYRVNAIITSNSGFTFKANGTETIRYLSTVSKPGGSITSLSTGDQIQLDWSGTQWLTSVLGTSWQLEIS